MFLPVFLPLGLCYSCILHTYFFIFLFFLGGLDLQWFEIKESREFHYWKYHFALYLGYAYFLLCFWISLVLSSLPSLPAFSAFIATSATASTSPAKEQNRSQKPKRPNGFLAARLPPPPVRKKNASRERRMLGVDRAAPSLKKNLGEIRRAEIIPASVDVELKRYRGSEERGRRFHIEGGGEDGEGGRIH